MRIDVRTRGAVTILHVSGKMVGREPADALRAAFTRLLAGNELVFILNLEDVVSADSGFLGELIACRERVRRRGGRIKVVVRDWLDNLLVVSELRDLFEVFDDEEEALDSFSPVGETAGIP